MTPVAPSINISTPLLWSFTKKYGLHEHDAETAVIVGAGIVLFVSRKSVALVCRNRGVHENSTPVVSREDAFAAIVAFLPREHMTIGGLGWDCDCGSDEADYSEDGCEMLHDCGAVPVTGVRI